MAFGGGKGGVEGCLDVRECMRFKGEGLAVVGVGLGSLV